MLDATLRFQGLRVSSHERSDILVGGIETEVRIQLVDYDPGWPDSFAEHQRRIRGALGDRAVRIEHIGSTAVPGLAAKPIIDVLLVVEKSSDEPSYLPEMEAAGYELRVREPDHHQHRMVRTPERDAHIHILSAGCVEAERYLKFRDRLRSDDRARNRYQDTKRRLAMRSWPDMNAYADAKSELIECLIGDSES